MSWRYLMVMGFKITLLTAHNLRCYFFFQDPQDANRLTPQPRPSADETNLSQCSSQESMCSETDRPQAYEKDESHLRPSSQNSNYSFNDVIASQSYNKMEGVECEKFEYEQENYEMYEQLAMAYQSDVASNVSVVGNLFCCH